MNDELMKYHFGVVDANNNPITSGLRVSVYPSGSGTAATIYADAVKTALTNPITSTVFGTKTGEIAFWYGAPLCDVVINDGIGRLVKIESLTPSQNRIVFDANEAVSGVMNNPTGTELVEVCGTFVEYAEQITFDGSALRAGDIIRVWGQVLAADFHTQEELDIKISMTDGSNTLLLLHTGDVVIAANADYVDFEAELKVISVGTSGKVRWHGRMWTNLNGTLALKNGTVEDGMSAAGSTLDTTGDITVYAEGDYKNAHADQESYAYLNVQVLKGVIVTT